MEYMTIEESRNNFEYRLEKLTEEGWLIYGEMKVVSHGGQLFYCCLMTRNKE